MAISSTKLKINCRTCRVWFSLVQGYSAHREMKLQVLEPILATRGMQHQTATGHHGILPRPGTSFSCPCLRSWGQLSFVAHSELHLWAIAEGWFINSSCEGYFNAEIYHATHKWMKTSQTYCMLAPDKPLLLEPALRGKVLSLINKNLSNSCPQLR